MRGTQSLVGQMGWVFGQPLLIAIEVGWRWLFGIPFLLVCWMQVHQILAAVPPETAGLTSIDTQNPWVAAVQIVRACSFYLPHVAAVFTWLAPPAAFAWVVVSGIGRSLVLQRIDPADSPHVTFRPMAMMVLQAAWLALLAITSWAWFSSMAWAIGTHIVAGAEPDLIGLAAWAIFLALGFFTAWALLSWPFAIAPILMLREERSALSALGQSLRLGKAFTGKLVEINLVMGIVNLALMVLAMVLSAAPLPFSDQLGAEALHNISVAAVVFYFVAGDYFQVVKLKGFVEFWKMFRSDRPVSNLP